MQPLLRDGALDFSIGRTPTDAARSEFHDEPVFSKQAVVVGHRDHPMQSCYTLHDPEDAKWLLKWDPADQISMRETLLGKHGMRVPKTVHPHIRCRSDSAC